MDGILLKINVPVVAAATTEFEEQAVGTTASTFLNLSPLAPS